MACSFSGIQPTSDIRIGNYLSALRSWLHGQRRGLRATQISRPNVVSSWLTLIYEMLESTSGDLARPFPMSSCILLIRLNFLSKCDLRHSMPKRVI